MDDRERPFAALLIGALVEWIEGLGVPDWARSAVVHSLADGYLARLVLQALSEARERGRREAERETPVVHVDQPFENPEELRPTLPTEPPVSYEDLPVTGRTSRGFPRVGR